MLWLYYAAVYWFERCSEVFLYEEGYLTLLFLWQQNPDALCRHLPLPENLLIPQIMRVGASLEVVRTLSITIISGSYLGYDLATVWWCWQERT